MDRGFYTILLAQFLSALADNALLIAALALLHVQHAPDWHQPMLVWSFALSYVGLAPFAGSFADSMHKGRAMLLCNGIKLAGCASMLLGMPPVIAYGIVGFGAAAYSPAKYGIITEYLPHDKLVAANGWLEGTTVGAVIFGTVLGGLLTCTRMDGWLGLSHIHGLPAPIFGIMVLCVLYLLAAWVNLFIPKLDVELKPIHLSPSYLVQEFWGCVVRLWRDPQGALSLAVTTLFWGAGSTMKLVVLDWAIIWLGLNLEQSTRLVAVVALGTAFGAYLAGRLVPLKQAFKVLPAGVGMGMLVIAMLFVHSSVIAACLLFLVGGLAGFFVVPLNAVLQHRGYLLMGAGHSIAVQNFNENIGIMVMVGAQTLAVKYLSGPLADNLPGEALLHFSGTGGLPPMKGIIITMGLVIMLVMVYLKTLHRRGERAGLMHD